MDRERACTGLWLTSVLFVCRLKQALVLLDPCCDTVSRRLLQQVTRTSAGDGREAHDVLW